MFELVLDFLDFFGFNGYETLDGDTVIWGTRK